jgi:hypothetical protein
MNVSSAERAHQSPAPTPLPLPCLPITRSGSHCVADLGGNVTIWVLDGLEDTIVFAASGYVNSELVTSVATGERWELVVMKIVVELLEHGHLPMPAGYIAGEHTVRIIDQADLKEIQLVRPNAPPYLYVSAEQHQGRVGRTSRKPIWVARVVGRSSFPLGCNSPGEALIMGLRLNKP